jgi:hypothetical protein
VSAKRLILALAAACLVLAAVATIPFSVRRQAAEDPFRDYLRAYAAVGGLVRSEKADPRIVGKAIAVTREGEIDDLFRRLPRRLRAGDPGEVGTVVVVDCREAVVGYYQHGWAGYRTRCDLRVVDFARRIVLAEKRFAGKMPPGSRRGGQDEHPGRPSAAMLAWLERLPAA